jgi:hypothetical protein
MGGYLGPYNTIFQFGSVLIKKKKIPGNGGSHFKRNPILTHLKFCMGGYVTPKGANITNKKNNLLPPSGPIHYY